MSKRTLAIAMVVVAVLLIAAVSIAVVNIDGYLESQRPRLEQEASRLLGRSVKAQRLKLLLFGGLGIEVDGLEIGDDPNYSASAFLNVDRLELQLSFLAALRQEIEISEARLIAPVLRLHQDASGWNVQSIGEKSSEEPAGEDGAPSESAGIRIGRFEIWQGQVLYRNSLRDEPFEVALRNVELIANDWSPGEFFAFEARAIVLDGDDHDTEIKATLRPQQDAPLEIDIDLKLIAYDTAKLIAFAPIAELLPPDLSASGPLDAEISATGPSESFDFEGQVDIEDVRMSGGLIAKTAGQPLSLGFNGKVDPKNLTLERFLVSSLGLSLAGNATMTRAEPAKLDFHASADEALLAALGLHGRERDPADAPEIVRGFDASGSLLFRKGAASTATIAMRSSEGLVRGIAWQNLTIHHELRAGKHVARIQAPKGSFGRVPYQELAADLQLVGDRIDLQGAKAKMIGGQIGATGHTKTANDGQRISQLSAQLTGARTEALFEAFQPDKKSNAEGLLNAEVDLTGSGATMAELRSSLKGSGVIKQEEGVLRNTNLAKGAVDAIVGIPVLSAIFTQSVRDASPELFASNDTHFETIVAQLDIGDGKVTTDEIEIVTSSYKIVGTSEITLDGEVDARAIFTFSEKYTQQLGSAGGLISGVLNPSGLLAIPIRVTGTPPNIETQADPVYVGRALRDGFLGTSAEGIVTGAGRLFDAVKGLRKK